MVPVNALESSWTALSLVSWPMLDEIGPVKPFELISKDSSAVREYKLSGICPVWLLLSRFSDVSILRSPYCSGIGPPRNVFDSKSREARDVKADSSLGRVPPKLFSPRWRKKEKAKQMRMVSKSPIYLIISLAISICLPIDIRLNSPTLLQLLPNQLHTSAALKYLWVLQGFTLGAFGWLQANQPLPLVLKYKTANVYLCRVPKTSEGHTWSGSSLTNHWKAANCGLVGILNWSVLDMLMMISNNAASLCLGVKLPHTRRTGGPEGVGEIDGIWDGAGVWNRVGAVVGCSVGFRVGCNVGTMAGAAVGRGIGWFVGAGVGRAFGRVVGWFVGRGIGWFVGRGVGWCVGGFVGKSVGALVGGFVGNRVGAFVGDGEGAFVGNTKVLIGLGVATGIGAAVGLGVGSAVGISVGIGVPTGSFPLVGGLVFSGCVTGAWLGASVRGFGGCVLELSVGFFEKEPK